MFYKIVLNHVPTLYNISKAKRVELVKNTIYLYYNYTSPSGTALIFWTDLSEDYDSIKCKSEEEAKYHFESIEKMLK